MEPRTEPERSIGQLFGDLGTEARTLLQQELTLARTELTIKARLASRQASYLAVGGVLGFVGLELLLGAVALVLGLVMPLWASLILVGVVVAAVAYVLLRHGLAALRKMDPRPTQTLLSIEDTKQWTRKLIH